MVDARDACDDQGSARKVLTDAGILRILRILQTCRNTEGGSARVVPIEEIEQDDFNLHAAHYNV